LEKECTAKAPVVKPVAQLCQAYPDTAGATVRQVLDTEIPNAGLPRLVQTVVVAKRLPLLSFVLLLLLLASCKRRSSNKTGPTFLLRLARVGVVLPDTTPSSWYE
jgi:hypothetical protein